MGLFSFLSDTLFGTEGQAQDLNQANIERALGLLGGVPLEQLLGQARAQFTTAPEESIRKGYGQAIGTVGQAGTGASLQALAAGKAAKGEARSNLLQRGLYGSSLLTGAQTGIQQQTNRTIADIMGQTAGAQGGLLAGQGQALAGATRDRESALANLYGLQANMQLGRAGQQAGLLGNVQYQGTPGVFGPLLGAAAGGFGGGLGLKLSGLFGQPGAPQPGPWLAGYQS